MTSSHTENIDESAQCFWFFPISSAVTDVVNTTIKLTYVNGIISKKDESNSQLMQKESQLMQNLRSRRCCSCVFRFF